MEIDPSLQARLFLGAVLLGVMVCFLVTVKQTMPRGIWRGLRRRSGNNNL